MNVIEGQAKQNEKIQSDFFCSLTFNNILNIIVMMILVGVTVSVVINSNLIGTAKRVADATKQAYEQEGNMSEIKINGKTYETIEDYFAGNEKIVEVHDWQYMDNTMTAIKCACAECKEVDNEGQILYIGQEIDYKNPEKWVIFGVEDKNKNGKNEGLLITTLEISTEKLLLEGAHAYNNGIVEINAKCKELYGTESRGMTIEDVNNALGYIPRGGMYNDGTNHVLDGFECQLNTLDMWDDIKAHNVANKEGKYYTPEYPEGTTDDIKLGSIKINGYLYLESDDGSTKPSVPETTSDIVKTLVFGESNNLVYWLASRGVYAYDACAYFGIGAVGLGRVDSYGSVFLSDGRTYDFSFSVRPVVSLTSEIPEIGEILVGEVTEE